jgi:hypothetical protein
MNKLLLIALWGSGSLLFSQNAGISPEAFRRLCADEKAPANLQLSDAKVVEGTVIDQTGAKCETGVAVLQSASVENGDFRLGQLIAGSYRLIVVNTTSSGPERLKMFDQPRSLVCETTGPICKLSVMPTVHGTDDLIDFCPPR